MSAAFRYRPRKGGPWQEAVIGGSITLEERGEYILAFPTALSSSTAQQLADLGGELLRPDTAMLGFDNFVGHADFAGVSIEVASTKIGPSGVSRILEEVSELASALIFGVRTPTTFAAEKDVAARPPVPFHQLQFLRHAMLKRPAGSRLQDTFAVIEQNPTRRFDRERPLVRPERAKRLDVRAIQAIFSHLDRLVPLPADGTLTGNPLALALTFGTPPTEHFPTELAVPSGRLSYDTPENRFIKHVVNECLALVYRFVDHPRIHAGLRADCRIMLGLLEPMAAAAFLREARQISGFQAPTQALAKADGYRDLFTLWSDLSAHISLPPTQSETMRMLEGRDMATLYEYWAFVKTIEAVASITGSTHAKKVAVRRDELSETLDYGLSVSFGVNVSVHFNPTFRRSAHTAYSTPLRPDIVVEVAGAKHALDAKYRLEKFETAENDDDDDSATYKRADLYKMHTYRDAISGLRTAFILYPGTEFVFFERSGTRRDSPGSITVLDGVGAIPLRPASDAPSDALRSVLSLVLDQ